MFRIGGSAGTGITSGLDQPRKQYAQGSEDRFMELVAELRERGFSQQEAIEEARRILGEEDMAKGGRVGYANGTPNPYNMGAFSPGSLPGFLTSFGLDLLSRPPQGNIFQTAAAAARDPFDRFQAGQAAAMKTASDRKFAKELAQEEREFEESQLEKKLAAQERIAGMDKTDNAKRIEKFTQDFGDEIKAARAVDFIDNKFQALELEYGKGQVATIPIDSDAFTGRGKKGALKKFADSNPRLLGLKLYDVAQDRVVVIRLNTTNNQLELVPADSADIDTTGDVQPAPGVKRSFDYLNPDQIKKLDELSQEDMFSDIYSGS